MDKRSATRFGGILLALFGALALVLGFMSPVGAAPEEDAEAQACTESVAAESADAGDNQHPSGKDRTEDSTDPQGNSGSDPDGTENGGEDKPCGGETNRAATDGEDQDGNNGCGNDDNFEDDNNGNCLAKGRTGDQGPDEEPEVDGDTEERPDAGSEGGTTTPPPAAPEVEGDTEERPAPAPADVAGSAETPRSAPAPQVLGQQFSRPAALAATGTTANLALAGGMLLLIGGLMVLGTSRKPAMVRL